MIGKRSRAWLSILSIFLLVFLALPFPSTATSNESQNQDFVLSNLILKPGQPVLRKEVLHLNFNRKDIHFQSTDQGLLLSLKSCENLNIPDRPALPCMQKTILLDRNECVIQIETIKVDTVRIPFPNVALKLAEPPHQISKNRFDTILRNVQPNLSVNNMLPDLFPSNNFDYVITEDARSKTLSLQINPVYLFHNQLILIENMQIRITFGTNEDFHITSLQDEKNHSIILSPDELKESAQALQTIQQKDGYTATVTLLSEIASITEAPPPQFEGVTGFLEASTDLRARISAYDNSLARKIQQYILQLSDQGKIQYLTIMGDATYIPPSYYVFSPDNMDSYDRWVPTDILYGAPKSGGKDFPLVVSVGRLPVRDKDEARQVVAKIDRYRKNLDPEWFRNVDFMAGDPFNGDYFGELSTTKAINLDYFEGMKINRFYKSEAKFTTEPFMNSMKAGKHGFVWGFGHGGGDGLALEPGYITSKNIMDLPEINELPIFLSEACGNGAFDTRLAKSNFGTNTVLKYPTSFSESIVLSKGGGIAYVGGARINYAGWNMNYDKGIPNLKRVYYMDSIIEYFSENYHKKAGALGDISRKALETYAQRDWFGVNAPLIKTFFGFTLQGDPTLKIPFFTGTKKRSVPQIQPDTEKPINMGNLPLFSIDDGSKLEVKSDADTLQYILVDYQNTSKPVKSEGNFLKASSNTFQNEFHDFVKTKMALRVITDDGKENRIVFLGRYNQDLVVKNPYDLKLLRNNEKKDYWVEVANDGIETAKNVTIQITDNGQQVREETFSSIPILSSRYVYYSIQSSEKGPHKILVKAPILPTESFKTDNQITNDVIVAEKRSYRIGVLNESPYLFKGYFENRLMLTELNKKLIDSGYNMEICVIPIAWDEKGKSNLDRLDLDAVILYTNDFYTFPVRGCMAELESFTNRGGIVFGFLCLGKNSAGADLSEVQTFFGISREETFERFNFDDVTKSFQVLDSTDNYFPKLSYEITSRFACLPKGKDWKNISMDEGEIIGLSSDNLYALIKKDNRFLFTGFLSEKDFRKGDQSLEFFLDLLNLVKNPKQDLIIESTRLDPPIGTKNQKSNLIVTVRNVGYKDAENISVVLNREIKSSIPFIQGKGTATTEFSLDWTGISGDKAYLVEINGDKAFEEKDYSNNVQKGIYHVAENNEPDTPPLLEITSKNKETVSESFHIISGKATPGSIIRMGQYQVAQNEDGSFKKVTNLKPGLNQFTFTAQKGSLFSRGFEYEVTLLKTSLLLMRIGDSKAILDNKILNLENPPFISKGSSYVPLRFVGEIFKADIQWNPKPNQEIKLQFGNKTIYLWIGKPIARIVFTVGETKEIKLSSSPLLINGRAFVPLRSIADMFDSKVLWNPENQSIEIQIPIQASTSLLNLLQRDEPVEPEKKGFVASANKTGLIINPSCIDHLGEFTYVSMYDGIYKFDADNKFTSMIPWDPEFVSAITEKQLRYASSMQNRGFFRMSETRIVISDYNNLYVLENPSGKLIQTIHGIEYRNYAEPFVRFTYIHDIEIIRDQLYVLDTYNGVSIVDLTKGDVVAKYAIGNYPMDMTIHKEKFYICTLYGTIVSMNFDGSDMLELGFDEDINFNSIAISDEDIFYTNTFYPENKVVRFTLTDSFQIKDQINLTNAGGTLIERMMMDGDKIRAITLNDKTIGTFALELKYVLFDENMKVVADFGKEDLKGNIKKEDYICNPGKVAITEKGEYIVFQDLPSNYAMYRLYDATGKWIRDIKLQPDDGRAEFLDSVYSGNQTLSVLYKLGGYFIQDYHFTNGSKLSSNVLKLQTKNRQLIPMAYTRTQDKIAIADAFSGSVILFNKETGLELSRIYGEANENYCGISVFSKLIIKEDLLYILDNKQSIVNVYALKDNLLESQYKIPSNAENTTSKPFDFQVMDSGKIVILDPTLSRISFFEKGILMETIGTQVQIPPMVISPGFHYTYWHPCSFDISDTVLLVNDFGNQRIVFDKYPKEEIQPASIIETSTELMQNITFNAKDIPFTIGFQIFNSVDPILVEAPEWVQIKKVNETIRSGIIDGGILSRKTVAGNPLEGSIWIKVGNLTKEILVKMERKLNHIQFINGSSMIIDSMNSYVSRNPILIEKSELYLPLSSLKVLFDFQIVQQKTKFVITAGTHMIECEANNSKAVLITSQGKSPLDLGRQVKTINKEFYVPINKIFELLGKKYSISSQEAWVDF